MNEFETISWIFLATALSSQESGAKLDGISLLADGINHAVPTQKELQESLKWLRTKELIKEDQNEYSLTDSGIKLIQEAKKKSNILLKQWDILETDLRNIDKNTVA